MDFYHYRQEIIIDGSNDVFQADVSYMYFVLLYVLKGEKTYLLTYTPNEG